MTDLNGAEFKDCHSAKVKIEIEGTKVNFIDLKHLKMNKQATDRNQDLVDLENLG